MNFSNKEFLRSHIQSILDFYLPNIKDETGGFFHNFMDDGSVFEPSNRHLVSSCRMVWIFSKAYELYGDEKYLSLAQHGVNYIREKHWDNTRQGYNWTLAENHQPDDQTNHCYGLAFVVLSFSAAAQVGIKGAVQDIETAFSIMEQRLWDESIGLYADEATLDWQEVSTYRGQNANMHSCEAFIAAYEATSHDKYLQRAYQLAKTVSVTLADKSDGLIWEHFTQTLDIDWDFNKDDPKNLYRPWGFQPGHQTEWTKLLLTLHQHKPEAWMIERSESLFNRAMDTAWDEKNGGIYYGFSPKGKICDDDKYFWVQAESFAAAARLFKVTGQECYSVWYDRIWDYAWLHMVDHEYGAWFRVLTADNKKYSEQKSTAGGKCDYHTIGACWDVLRIL
ncbi:AGE family epimerase/isomerase [Paraglaciecola sp.]|uniref:AGE family epimerase/isomerase n=1 Tax=Paraglaciecola sp. TaxID=1920173 RepID=UPI003EF94602